MSQVILLSLTASFNPTLVAATTVMLLLDNPAKLMLGYLLGAYVTSITLGLVIVFSASNSSTTNTTENTLSPAVDIALGCDRADRRVGSLERTSGALYTAPAGAQSGKARQGSPEVAAGAEQGISTDNVRHRDAAHPAWRLLPCGAP